MFALRSPTGRATCHGKTRQRRIVREGALLVSSFFERGWEDILADKWRPDSK
jgi:hypothetical protein